MYNAHALYIFKDIVSNISVRVHVVLAIAPIITDAFSKWPEIHEIKSTTAEAIISKLKHIFAAQGLPKRIVSDNGPQFVASEFQQFCQLLWNSTLNNSSLSS